MLARHREFEITTDKLKVRETKMGISSVQFRHRDVFIHYDFEEVFFRYERETRKFFRKFYGEEGEGEVPFDNRLLNDAIRFGEETDEATYASGKPARNL
jgi:hypothetical protein